MKMKRMISGALFLMMLFTTCIGANAEEITTDGGYGDTIISYGTSERFTITIPSDVNFSLLGQTSSSVSASDVMIGSGKTLEVRVSGDDYVDKWELIDVVEPDNKIAYGIKAVMGNNGYKTFEVVNNDVILSVDAGEIYHSQLQTLLDFYLLEDVTKAGTYTDTLTFTANIVSE